MDQHLVHIKANLSYESILQRQPVKQSIEKAVVRIRHLFFSNHVEKHCDNKRKCNAHPTHDEIAGFGTEIIKNDSQQNNYAAE